MPLLENKSEEGGQSRTTESRPTVNIMYVSESTARALLLILTFYTTTAGAGGDREENDSVMGWCLKE